jgi:hypothetical protein
LGGILKMKKLSLIIVLGFVAILLNSCAADRNVDGFTNKAIDTAKKTAMVNEDEWTVYTSPLITSNNGVSNNNVINYQAFDPNYPAETVSISIWVKNDNSDSFIYIFGQYQDGEYIEAMLRSMNFNSSGTAIQGTYSDSFGQANLNAMSTPSALMNVNITMNPGGNFVTNGVFTKVMKRN